MRERLYSELMRKAKKAGLAYEDNERKPNTKGKEFVLLTNQRFFVVKPNNMPAFIELVRKHGGEDLERKFLNLQVLLFSLQKRTVFWEYLEEDLGHGAINLSEWLEQEKIEN